MYHPEHFSASELVPPEEHARWGAGAIMVINPLLCITLDQLRKRHGRLIVNSSGRDRQQSGLRTVEFYRREYRKLNRSQQDKKYIASRSAHIRGDAADCIPLDTSLVDIHADIKANPDLYPFLHFVETDITWLHVDVRNQPDITFWSPKRGVVDVVKQQPIEWGKIAPGL
jgi:hypothetical protein